MSPLETLARDAFERNREINNPLLDECLERWEDQPQALHDDWQEFMKAALQSLIRMAEGNEKVQIWLEAMADETRDS